MAKTISKRTKNIKINGVKAKVIIPKTLKRVPAKLISEQNHAKGLLVKESKVLFL